MILNVQPLHAKENQYFQVDLKSTELDQAAGFVGYILESDLYLLTDEGKWQKFSLKESGIEEKSQDQDTQIDAPPKKSKQSQGGLEIQYTMTDAETHQCEKLSEFKSFLQQATLLKSHIPKLEVLASGSEYEKCSNKLVQLLRKSGIKTSSFIGNLPKGGIVIRSSIYTVVSKANGQLADRDRERKKSLSSQGAIDLEVRINGSQWLPLNVSLEGYFAYSHAQIQKGQFEFRMHKNSKSYSSQFYFSTHFISLGEQELEDGKFLFYKIGSWDLVTRINTPPSFIKKIVADAEAKRRRDVLVYVSAGKFINQQTSNTIKPFNIKGFYDVSLRYFLDGDVVVPVEMTKETANFSLVQGKLNYRLINNQELGDTWELSASAGGIFYHAKRTNQFTSGTFLSDYLGVLLGSNLKIRLSEKWKGQLSFAVSPTLSVGPSKASLSTFINSQVSYDISADHYLAFIFDRSNYSQKFTSFQDLSTQISRFSLGYGWVF
ncbi:MAG: hypothetical protein H6623_00270 [Bdellovibrionaceae bacterium]|nr:hypothetical protein [Pseudobdellovibrionaceae bacterium]